MSQACLGHGSPLVALSPHVLGNAIRGLVWPPPLRRRKKKKGSLPTIVGWTCDRRTDNSARNFPRAFRDDTLETVRDTIFLILSVNQPQQPQQPRICRSQIILTSN
jgi:hypothetical protein